MEIVLGVAGGIGSGKTEFVSRLSTALGVQRVGFGEYLRVLARARGLPESRQTLQELGEQELRLVGAPAFARAALGQYAEAGSVVVDGVRHVEIARALRALLLPRRFVLVFLDVDDEVRKERLRRLRPDDSQQLGELASHSTERQVHDGSLRGEADLVIDGKQEPGLLVGSVLAWMNSS